VTLDDRPAPWRMARMWHAPTVPGGLRPLPHGLGHGPIGALVSAWPAVALIGSFELLMMLVRSARRASVDQVPAVVVPEPAPIVEQDVPLVVPDVPALVRSVREMHDAGHSQRAIARDLNIDRRNVKRLIEQAA
jgi:hypothetical protein